VLKKPDGKLFRDAPLNGGWMYYVCTKRAWDLFIKNQLDQTRALGYKGILYIDVLSARQPDPCFDKNHPANRKEQAEYHNKTLAYAKQLFGGSASECGFDHCIQNLDYVNYLGRDMLYGEGVEKDKKGNLKVYNKMIDRVAPFWEIVYHGITLSNPDKFTQGFLPKGSTARLRLIEFGGRPIFYSVSDKNMNDLKASYDQFMKLRHLQLEEIMTHKKLADGVFLITYSDGSRILVNYTDKPFEYDGETTAAKDFRLYNPSFWSKVKNLFN
jgi:hypothetical protein